MIFPAKNNPDTHANSCAFLWAKRGVGKHNFTSHLGIWCKDKYCHIVTLFSSRQVREAEHTATREPSVAHSMFSALALRPTYRSHLLEWEGYRHPNACHTCGQVCVTASCVKVRGSLRSQFPPFSTELWSSGSVAMSLPSSASSPFGLRTGLHSSWLASALLCSRGRSRMSNLPSSSSFVLGLWVCTKMSSYMWCWGLNLGLHVCQTSTPPAD